MIFQVTNSKLINVRPTRQLNPCADANEKHPYYCKWATNDVSSEERNAMKQGLEVQMYVYLIPVVRNQ